MQITNKLGLPSTFKSMVDNNYEYKDKQYGVTSLLNDSLRETILKRRHHNEIVQDVADMIWLIVGNGIHYVLEQSQEETHELKEEYLRVEVIPEYRVSGKADLYNEQLKKVIDYKTCSVWKIVYGDYADWRKQTLIYCWMFNKLGFEANTGEIVAIMKDHSKTKAKVDPSYPQFPVQTITFNFTEKDFIEMEEYLMNKFDEIKKLEDVPDDELPLCSLNDRFNSGDKYAIKKKKNKRALRVYDDVYAAHEHLDSFSEEEVKDYEIETRKGEDKKCLEYCSVCEFCNHYIENYK